MLIGCLSLVAACVLAGPEFTPELQRQKFKDLRSFQRRALVANVLRPFRPLRWSWTLLDTSRGLAGRLLVGNGTSGPDAMLLLGDSDFQFLLGEHIVVRYPHYGYEVFFDIEVGQVVGLKPIPPRIPPHLPDNVKKDMAALQGLWERDLGHFSAYMEFDGELVTLFGGGVALTFSYRLDPKPTPKQIHLSVPIIGTVRQAWVSVMVHGAQQFPGQGSYSIMGDTLELRLAHKIEPGEANKDDKEKEIWKRKRGPLY